MPSARQWVGSILLSAPAPLRSLRNVPVFGAFVHRFSHWILPADQKVWVQVESGPAKGIWMELNPRTGQNYLQGHGEMAIQEILAQKLNPGAVFYDLGANIGFFSLLAARLVGPAGKVFSFEPDPEVAHRLRRNIAHNGFTNVVVVEAGIWSHSGKVNFVAADSSSPDRGVGRFTSVEDQAGTPTPCIALDDFIRDAPGPDAIKCDIEAAEVEAFLGAGELLEKHRPWIVCEMHSEANDKFLREYLGSRGYGLDLLDAGHVLAVPQPVVK